MSNRRIIETLEFLTVCAIVGTICWLTGPHDSLDVPSAILLGAGIIAWAVRSVARAR